MKLYHRIVTNPELATLPVRLAGGHSRVTFSREPSFIGELPQELMAAIHSGQLEHRIVSGEEMDQEICRADAAGGAAPVNPELASQLLALIPEKIEELKYQDLMQLAPRIGVRAEGKRDELAARIQTRRLELAEATALASTT